METVLAIVPRPKENKLHMYVFTEYGPRHQEFIVSSVTKTKAGYVLETNDGTVTITDKFTCKGMTATCTIFVDAVMEEMINFLKDGSKINSWYVNTTSHEDEYIHLDPYFDVLAYKIDGEEVISLSVFDSDAIYLESKIFWLHHHIVVIADDKYNELIYSKLPCEPLKLRCDIGDVTIENGSVCLQGTRDIDQYLFVTEKVDNTIKFDKYTLTVDKLTMLTVGDSAVHVPARELDVVVVPTGFAEAVNNFGTHTIIAYNMWGYLVILTPDREPVSFKIEGVDNDIITLDFAVIDLSTFTINGKPTTVKVLTPVDDKIYLSTHTDYYYILSETNFAQRPVANILADKGIKDVHLVGCNITVLAKIKELILDIRLKYIRGD